MGAQGSKSKASTSASASASASASTSASADALKQDGPTATITPPMSEQASKDGLAADAPLFSASLLDQTVVDEAKAAGLQIRPLQRYLNLLSELTTVGEVDEQAFTERFDMIKNTSNTYYIVVIEDVESKKLVAAGTVILEGKFARNCGKVAHVEDIVTTTARRGQNLGRRIITQLKHVSKELGCYKVILDCADKNVEFYGKLGFEKKENQMALYF